MIFYDMRHPNNMWACENGTFLSYSAGERKITAPAWNQFLPPLLFLYYWVLNQELEWIAGQEIKTITSGI